MITCSTGIWKNFISTEPYKEDKTMMDYFTTFIDQLNELKNIQDVQERARAIYDLACMVNIDTVVDTCTETIARRGEIMDDLNDAVQKDNLGSVHFLIQGIELSDLGSTYFQRDGYGNYNPLTHDMLDNLTDDLITELNNNAF